MLAGDVTGWFRDRSWDFYCQLSDGTHHALFLYLFVGPCRKPPKESMTITFLHVPKHSQDANVKKAWPTTTKTEGGHVWVGRDLGLLRIVDIAMQRFGSMILTLMGLVHFCLPCTLPVRVRDFCGKSCPLVLVCRCVRLSASVLATRLLIACI